ncbi:DMSO/TMAO reductase YedYZ, molybdopterin-dependent catalytic subunit [Friedmanniella luteola]|uniref:DMSO/TMAO reductase YedYZ, molybdopterin-dependent catalytic subunit n=1 Tax=Friedmanniella luteola TaxID=546871 RepID=A0A1H1ZAU8_9ACTN|nr:molybdopterin-dependent oxidoreductase [Friedmanniella luteola]SDT30336.1 DMSO/TMAO reductase YedYZ, molybdopterin-dependent catalytic subunit [Friedmanniella luteola]
MTTTLERPPAAAPEGPPAQPRPALRALSGVLAAGAAVGVGHLVAALTDPVTSPVLAVGSALIDAAPTPAKEFAVRTFGTADKPILVGSVGVVLLVFAAVVGLVAWRRPRTAAVAIGLLGVAGAAAALTRGPLTDVVPSVVAGVVGVLALQLLRTRTLPGAGPAAGSPASATDAAVGRSRRGFLLALGGTAAVAALAGGGGFVVGKVRDAGSAARRALGLPAPASAAAPLPAGVQLPGMTPFTTPADAFYRVDISLVTPRIDASSWSLTVDGMVDRPVTLSYDDLLALPMIERDITLTCVSNEVGGSYVSTGRWLGVPFSAIIERVGVQAGVDQVYSYSADSGYTCSTPFQAVSDGRDAMVVVGLNGQPLADERGYPARMLVPGLFGFVSATKWLERIEFTTYAKRTAYWTERDWATDAPVLTQSRIDVPKSLATLAKDKPVIAGVAWAQHRGIAKVEIRIDDGDWQETTLADDGGIDLWRQWSFRYDGPAGLHSAQVRATDLDGETQPEERTKVFPDGARGWHQIQFTAE